MHKSASDYILPAYLGRSVFKTIKQAIDNKCATSYCIQINPFDLWTTLLSCQIGGIYKRLMSVIPHIQQLNTNRVPEIFRGRLEDFFFHVTCLSKKEVAVKYNEHTFYSLSIKIRTTMMA